MNIKATSLLFVIYLLTACMPRENLDFQTLMPGVPGGYYAVEINSKEVERAALFALRSQAKREKKSLQLLKVLKASQQVVAGMNYQLELLVKNEEKTYRANALVFQSLNDSYELTSWQWLPSETAE